MYGKVLSACTGVGCGAAVLPNTGGNVVLTVASLVSIAVGSVVLLSVAAQIIAKRAYKA